MKKVILLFLVIISNLLFSAQIITDGQISFYYDEQNNIIKNIKGNQLNGIDITELDIGVIEDKKYYRLKEYYENVEYDLENSEINIKGNLNKNKFTIKLKISSEISNNLEVEFISSNKKIEKIIYGIKFLNEIGFVEFYKNTGYIYNNRIQFSDSRKIGVFVLSEDYNILENIYRFLKVEQKENIKGKNSYFVIELNEEKNIFNIKFGDLNNNELKNSKIEIKKNIYFENEDRELYIKQMDQLKVLLSRGVVIDKITENITEISYFNELDMKILGYRNGIAGVKEILPKGNYTRAEELYYNYSIYKLVLKDDFLFKYRDIVETKVKNFIDISYNMIFKTGELRELYYLIKIMELLETRGIKEYEIQKNQLINLINEEYFFDNKLKNNKLSLLGSDSNMKYMDILYEENINSVINFQFENYFDKRYKLLIKDNFSNLIDLNYNLDFIKLLKITGKEKKYYIMLGKIEEIIGRNNYYIPLYYDKTGDNNEEIYGELIVKYIDLYLE